MQSLRNLGALLVLVAAGTAGCRNASQAPALKELQRAHSGALNVVLLAGADTLQRGKGSFVVEFRGADGSLVDVGTVSISATMAMPGMAPMFGDTVATATATTGRYEVTSDFGMAGTWRIRAEWNGPAGRGSTSLAGTVT